MWVLAFNEELDPEWLVLAKLESFRDHQRQDHTCVLEADDHSEFRHQTIVDYKSAACYEVQKVLAGMGTKMNPCGPLKEMAYQRLVNGFATSPHTSPRCLDLLAEQELIERSK